MTGSSDVWKTSCFLSAWVLLSGAPVTARLYVAAEWGALGSSTSKCVSVPVSMPYASLPSPDRQNRPRKRDTEVPLRQKLWLQNRPRRRGCGIGSTIDEDESREALHIFRCLVLGRCRVPLSAQASRYSGYNTGGVDPLCAFLSLMCICRLSVSSHLMERQARSSKPCPTLCIVECSLVKDLSLLCTSRRRHGGRNHFDCFRSPRADLGQNLLSSDSEPCCGVARGPKDCALLS